LRQEVLFLDNRGSSFAISRSENKTTATNISGLWITANANSVATIASKAFPPFHNSYSIAELLAVPKRPSLYLLPDP
jgi:hypothetical protein